MIEIVGISRMSGILGILPYICRDESKNQYGIRRIFWIYIFYYQKRDSLDGIIRIFGILRIHGIFTKRRKEWQE